MRGPTSAVGDLVGPLAPQVLAAVVRHHGHFDLAEDAVQEALLAAARQWPADGVPRDPRAWLVTVASRRLVDALRADSARRRREERTAREPGGAEVAAEDDTLALLVMCCHPSLTPPSQVALTLRAVGGRTTAEIAAAFMVPETTMAQRISRAKATIRAAGARFGVPADVDLAPVLHVLYLVFNEGYAATAGPDLLRRDLTAEALRLVREVHRLRPGDAEVAGLLALMLLTEARRPARVRDGDLVPLARQERSLWDRAAIAEGVALVERTLATTSRLGPYQLQAAIAAVHDEAPTTEATDWTEVLALYDLLVAVAPNPMAELNRAVAVAEVHGPAAGLAVLDVLELDHHRVDAVRGHLLEQVGDLDGARDAFRRASRRTLSLPEQRHLARRAASVG